MTIGRKLYSSFGAVLAMVLVLFLVNLTAVYREHSAKAAAGKALQLADASDKVRFQMMQNRLYLSNYLLSGDSREVERMNDGARVDRKSTRLNSSHGYISYAVFCLKKKNNKCFIYTISYLYQN